MHKQTENDVDHDLLQAVAASDKNAFERLYRRYFKRLSSFAVRVTARPDLSEDVAIDTMMVVWRKAGDFSSKSQVSTWIFGIAHRVALNAVRKSQINGQDDDVDVDDLSSAQSGHEVLEQVFLRDQLGRAMQELSVEQRSVVELTYYYGCTCVEISEIMSCPVGTVKTRMRQARKILKSILSPGQGHKLGATL